MSLFSFDKFVCLLIDLSMDGTVIYLSYLGHNSSCRLGEMEKGCLHSEANTKSCFQWLSDDQPQATGKQFLRCGRPVTLHLDIISSIPSLKARPFY